MKKYLSIQKNQRNCLEEAKNEFLRVQNFSLLHCKKITMVNILLSTCLSINIKMCAFLKNTYIFNIENAQI